MEKSNYIEAFVSDLQSLGVRSGGVLLVHASLNSLGIVPGGAETVIQGLLQSLGNEGTLLMPALTYETVRPPHPDFDIHSTPSCVGIIPETFRLRTGTQRSLHPTHSVCAVGLLAEALLAPHFRDSTPCGPNSPFHRLPEFEGQILMLGCGLRPNTSIHAIEELIEPSFLFGPPIIYTLTDQNGYKTEKRYTPHHFKGWEQRYDRVTDILTFPDLRVGSIMEANGHLIEARALRKAALGALKKNPLFFVDRIVER